MHCKTIHCISLESNEVKWDDRGRVWPCCYYAARVGQTGKTGDEYIDNLPDDWNSLNHHPLFKILQHDAFSKHWQPVNWDSDSCPKMCKENCTVGSDIEIVKYNTDEGNQ